MPMPAEAPLADPPGPGRDPASAGLLLDQRFDADTLHQLRATVLAHAVRAGLPEDRVGDVMPPARTAAPTAPGALLREYTARADGHGAAFTPVRRAPIMLTTPSVISSGAPQLVFPEERRARIRSVP